MLLKRGWGFQAVVCAVCLSVCDSQFVTHRYLASLYADAILLLITGRIGISALCGFSWALRFGGAGFFCLGVLSGVYLQLDYGPDLSYVLIFGIIQWGIKVIGNLLCLNIRYSVQSLWFFIYLPE
jgi:hypothetical protein